MLVIFVAGWQEPTGQGDEEAACTRWWFVVFASCSYCFILVACKLLAQWRQPLGIISASVVIMYVPYIVICHVIAGQNEAGRPPHTGEAALG